MKGTHDMQNTSSLISAIEDFQAGRVKDARVKGEAFLRDEPDDPYALLLLGNCALEEMEYDVARSFFKQCIVEKPDLRESYFSLAQLDLQTGCPESALACLQPLLDLDNQDFAAMTVIAQVLLELGHHEKSAQLLKLALAIEPSNATAHVLMGRCSWQIQGGVEEAVGHCINALAIDPMHPDAINNIGNYLLRAGDAVAACKYFEKLIVADNGSTPLLFSNWLLTSHYRDDITAQELFRMHQEWQARHGEKEHSDRFDFPNAVDCDRTLKVGFVSPDLYSHSVSYFLDALFQSYDRDDFYFVCFSDHPESKDDIATQVLKSHVNEWHYVKRLTAKMLREKVEEVGIDILIDLAGHTARNRMVAFSKRMAPVQATWLGYPDTTGLHQMDFRIVDNVTDPAGQVEGLATEKLYRLPDTFLCYKYPDAVPDVSCKEVLTPGKIVFGTFNDAGKFSPSVMKVWCEILKQIPEAELVFKGRQFGEDKSKEFMIHNFKKYGVDETRLRLLAFNPSRDGHMETYHQVDVALDPFPYNGTTTSFEALWMGVPFISKKGDRHCARVGMSLLKSIGLEEFIAESNEEYVQKAVAIAANREKLLKIKLGLRERMKESVLCDHERFARHFGNALRDMWRQWCKAKQEKT